MFEKIEVGVFEPDLRHLLLVSLGLAHCCYVATLVEHECVAVLLILGLLLQLGLLLRVRLLLQLSPSTTHSFTKLHCCWTLHALDRRGLGGRLGLALALAALALGGSLGLLGLCLRGLVARDVGGTTSGLDSIDMR